MRKTSVFLLCLLTFLIWLAPAFGQDARLRILHINDFHGFAEPYRPLGRVVLQGGAAYLAYQVKKLRQERPSLFLAAGDLIQGDNFANLFEGASVMELMNAMGLDAMVVGNHEFDFGQEVLKKRLAEAVFPVLGANVQGFPGLKPYVVKEVGGLKVGIIGVVTPDAGVTTHPKNVVGLTFTPPEAVVRQYLAELKPRVDVLVVLSHLGYDADRRLATEVPGIDLIVGGHSHTKLARPAKVNGTFIAQAYEHGKVLGVVDLTVKGNKIAAARGRLVEIGPSKGPADQEVLGLVKKYQDQIETRLGEPVGETEVDLEAELIRVKETNLGDLVADAVRRKAGAEVALINSGSIRRGIHRGVITRKLVYLVLPFDNYIVSLKLTGRELKEALEHGVSAVEEQKGRFLQVSGLAFTYNPAAPPGQRVMEVTVGGEPLQPQRVYAVATNDFLAAGGDGFKVLGEALSKGGAQSVGGMLKSEQLVYNDPATWMRDVVIDDLRAKGKVAPREEGRIREVK